MKNAEERYPVLKRFPEFLEAVSANEYVVANGYLSGAVLEDNGYLLEGNPVFLISRDLVEQYLEPGKNEAEKGETLKDNIRELLMRYEPNTFLCAAFRTLAGREMDVCFDTCTYGSRRNGFLVTIFDEWDHRGEKETEEAEEKSIQRFLETVKDRDTAFGLACS
jgi:hypothetical protein